MTPMCNSTFLRENAMTIQINTGSVTITISDDEPQDNDVKSLSDDELIEMTKCDSCSKSQKKDAVKELLDRYLDGFEQAINQKEAEGADPEKIKEAREFLAKGRQLLQDLRDGKELTDDQKAFLRDFAAETGVDVSSVLEDEDYDSDYV
jgi:hypothetical protein